MIDDYSEDYFSSGSDDEHLVGGQGSKSKERRKLLTNDELLYDPDMDDEDEKWVIKQRRDHRQKGMMSVNLTVENWFELNNVIVYSSYYWMMYVMSIISVYMVLFYWENSRQLGIIKLLPDCSINL